jgi:hypothetical protein
VIYSFDTNEALKSARNVFTTKRNSLDQGVFIDKQECQKLREKRLGNLNKDSYGN